MKTSFFFVFRIAAAWTFAYLVFLFVWSGVFSGSGPDGLFFLLFLVTLGFVIASGLIVSGSGSPAGIEVYGAKVAVDGNQVAADSSAGVGIWGTSGTACSSNIVAGFATNYASCAASVNNIDLS